MAESERQQGAQLERDSVKAWGKRNQFWLAGTLVIRADDLYKYLGGRAERYNKRPGGLSGKDSRSKPAKG